MEKLLKMITRDANKLDNKRARATTYAQEIVKEQKGIIAAAESGIEKINSDLTALRRRLQLYTGPDAKPQDEIYSDLKFRYEQKLGERNILFNAISIAEESIAASELNHIPGEDTRQ